MAARFAPADVPPIKKPLDGLAPKTSVCEATWLQMNNESLKFKQEEGTTYPFQCIISIVDRSRERVFRCGSIVDIDSNTSKLCPLSTEPLLIIQPTKTEPPTVIHDK
jgi:hypothetical protein